ncbi:MAG: tRNA 4-thiouridine(8) synthase ThiI [Clostridia bacterium]|nr:tRNA 4-thiouridine(8) synthase ThiI [Clostridia bacterium]MDE7328705.1 tRNA 4-thiouridine(8) synthase ThiI [Clostridia bacterium]
MEKKQVILLRYGELFLKGKNRNMFEKRLIENIKKSLTGIEYKFIRTQNRYYIEDYDENSQDEIIQRVSKVFGLHSLSIATKLPTSYDNLKEAINDFAPQDGAFRVTTKRADKSLDKTSMQISAMLGGYLLSQNAKLSVDLYYPKSEICVDIRENGYSYIFSDKIECAQGMPVGTAGRGMLLLSGGFDSPVAGYRMARRGMEIFGVHYHSYPHTSELARQKVIDLAGKLTKYCGDIRLFVVKFTNIQQAIHEYCREDYMITIMRRIMVEIAEKLAMKHHCGALITGESLAQVASQTTKSITVTNDAVKSLPVFRPLIGMDKYEIMETAEKIDTYAISELPYEDCCTVFLPKNPVIKPDLEVAKKEQAKIIGLDKMIEEAIEGIEDLYIKMKY